MVRMRIATAFLLIAVAWGGALYLHRRHVTSHHAGGRNVVCGGNLDCVSQHRSVYSLPTLNGGYTTTTHPSWEDPVALALLIGSAGVALALLPLRMKMFRP